MIGLEPAWAEEVMHHHHAAEKAVELSLLSSYSGGLHSLFSIWFFCLLQISPFLLAFLLGTTTLEPPGSRLGNGVKKVVITGLLALTGFSVIFTIIGASATSAAVVLYRYLSLLNQIGGILILLIGLYFIGVLTLPKGTEKKKTFPILCSVSAVLFGMALAFAYKPCVTPTLSEIFNYTKDPRTVSEGTVFLIFYSAGVSTSLLSVGTLISSIVLILKNEKVIKAARIFSGTLLIVMGILILTDWMVAYKSLLVGGFVK